MNPPVALTVAGTDSGGAAGIAADLATFAALGVHGTCVVTAVTAQDTTGVHDVHAVPQASIDAQLGAVFADLPVAAVKTGMLGTPEAVALVAQRLVSPSEAQGPRSDSQPALVVDPVLVATSGAVLGDTAVCHAYVEHLLPIATVATPNLDEARALAAAAGLDPDQTGEKLAAALTEVCAAVVLTGGGVTATECIDWLALRGAAPIPLRHPALTTINDHGTGCTYAAALAAHLAHGTDLADAAAAAAAYVLGQLRLSSDWTLGRGRGPVAHVSTSPSTRGDAK